MITETEQDCKLDIQFYNKPNECWFTLEPLNRFQLRYTKALPALKINFAYSILDLELCQISLWIVGGYIMCIEKQFKLNFFSIIILSLSNYLYLIEYLLFWEVLFIEFLQTRR